MPRPVLDSDLIRLSQEEHVLRITLDRADKRNALTQDMYGDLNHALAYARDEASVHAVLLDAAGETFCAGNDIGDFASADPNAGPSEITGPALAFIRALHTLDKPTVAAVQGQAIGIGTTLLLHTDLVVAGDSARFYTAFIDLALVPEAGSSLLLPALVGRQNAARLLLAGDTLDAVEALHMGLIAYKVTDTELDAQASTLARRLAAKPAEAIRLTKQLLRAGCHGGDVEGQLTREAAIFARRLFSAEARAVMAHFRKRRG